MATPVIEEMETLQPIKSVQLRLPWKDLWRHTIGSAVMTREILVVDGRS